MKRFMVGAVVAALLVWPLAGAGNSEGLTAAQLEAAGWTCFPVPGLGVHCAAPNQPFPPTGPTAQLLYFDEDTGAFAGTESLVRADIFAKRATAVCPTDPSGGWFQLPFGYWACHRS